MLMVRGRVARAVLAGAFCLAAVSVAGVPSPAQADPPPSNDDGQVIVVPGDLSGLVAPPHIDLRALEQRGQAPVRPGGAPATSPDGREQQAGAGGSVDSASGIPPGCFVGGFGVGGGPGGIGPRGGAFGMRCLPPLPAAAAPPGAPAALPVPTPADLAAHAFEQLRLPLPVPRHSPAVRLPDG